LRSSRPVTRSLPRAWRAHWGAWLVPVAVVFVAVGLVAVRSLGNGSAAPAASSSPIAGPALAADAVPRYYVYVGEAKNPATGKLSGPAVVVGDRQAGKTIAAYRCPAERHFPRRQRHYPRMHTGWSTTRRSAARRTTGRSWCPTPSAGLTPPPVSGQVPFPPPGTWCGSSPVPPIPSGWPRCPSSSRLASASAGDRTRDRAVR
jgi:hypothetical protein